MKRVIAYITACIIACSLCPFLWNCGSLPQQPKNNAILPHTEAQEEESSTESSFVDVQPFETGKSNLHTVLLRLVMHNAEVLKSYPERCIELVAYTNYIGAFNLQLAADRAQEVKKQLLKLGIAEQRISIRAVGSDYVIPDSLKEKDDAEHRRLPRRVEFIWKSCDSLR